MPRQFRRASSFFLVALLAFSSSSALGPLQASKGNILIDATIAPSPASEVEIGGNVSLYFGEVTWSGGQVELYLSRDGYASLPISSDTKFGSIFSVAKINDNATDSTTYPGYTVGGNWINGTIPKTLEVSGGVYFVKAFDGSTSTVVVTDRCLTITASFIVAPKYGPGQALIKLKGYALPSDDYVNLSYSDGDGWKTIVDLYPTGENGRFTYSMPAPELAEVLPDGLNLESYSTISFRLIVNGTGQTLVGTFDEYRRGLRQVYSPDSMNLTAPPGSLFGNNTNFIPHELYVRVKGDLTIAGQWFSPETIVILWDAATLMGTTTTGENGFFNATVTVPITSEGTHDILIEDATVKFVFKVHCLPLVDKIAPDAKAGPDQSVDEDTIVIFDGSGSTDNIGIVSYVWTFIDGEPKRLSGVNPTYSFTDPEVYLVTLQVTDVAGNCDTDELVITVLDATCPIADAGPDQTVNEDTLVTLNGSRSTDNIRIVRYVWTFTENIVWTLTGVTATHNFTTPGVYSVTLKVTDAEGNSGTDVVLITVIDVTNPLAEAGFNQTVPEGSVVRFYAGYSRDNLGIVAFEWDFGDGTNGTGLTANHTYLHSGSYTVSLTVRDQAGNGDADSVVITVLRDTDGDLMPDIADNDDDGDGMPDVWEAIFGLNPVDPADASGDSDGDGLTNLQEYLKGTNPNDFFSPLNLWIVGFALVPLVGVAITVYLARAITKVTKQEFVEREISEFVKRFPDIEQVNPGYYEWKVTKIKQEAKRQFDELRQRRYVLVSETPMRQRLAKELRRKIRKLTGGYAE